MPTNESTSATSPEELVKLYRACLELAAKKQPMPTPKPQYASWYQPMSADDTVDSMLRAGWDPV